jgi:hypothetical protein
MTQILRQPSAKSAGRIACKERRRRKGAAKIDESGLNQVIQGEYSNMMPAWQTRETHCKTLAAEWLLEKKRYAVITK